MAVTKAEPAPAKAAPVPSPAPAPARPAEPQAGTAASGAGSKAEASKDLQKGAGNQKAAAVTTAVPPPVTPVELKGQAEFPLAPEVDSYLQAMPKQTGDVPVQFGKLASGTITMRRREGKEGQPRYESGRQAIDLYHPLFRGIEDPALKPKLVVDLKDNAVTGYVGFGEGDKVSDNLEKYVKKTPELLGLAGFDLPKVGMTNRIEAGAIHLGLDAPIVLGGAFSGHIKIDAIDEAIAFEANAEVQGKGLASGNLQLARSVEGVITGQVAVQLNLPKNFSGGIDVAWDGRAINGQGKVGYQGEKFSGEVILKLMEASEAAKLEREKKAPPEEAGKAREGEEAGSAKKKGGKVDYAVFGEGDLTFAFTDWLSGTAHVIVDSRGFVTVIGEITPQKEFPLFKDPKEYVKPIFKAEARASYGIPVVGNIFLFANVGMDAFAKMDGKLYNIAIKGTYSTDPEKSKSFSIQGTLNISAGAGLRLRGEGGVGLEILSHDIKAGAGVNGIAGIKGYAEATPIIGYREKAAEGEDKKGEFFIRGELEIVAQPFLGLSGDLFVELDSPWWSPAPDKKWTWPLGSKEWPLGGSFGIGANVDYVFGSGQLPSIDFKKVDFSAEKFMSDLMNDRTKPKSAAAGDKKGEWKEKNSAEAEPPKGAAGGAPGGTGVAGSGQDAKSKVQPGVKGAKGEADPNARTAEGQTVKELQAKAEKEGKAPPKKETAGPKTADKKTPDSAGPKKEHDDRVVQGLRALDRLTDYYSKDGAEKEDLVRSVKSVRRQFGFKSIDIIDGGDTWDYDYVASPGSKHGGPPQKGKTGKTAAKPGEAKGDKKAEDKKSEYTGVKPKVGRYKNLKVDPDRDKLPKGEIREAHHSPPKELANTLSAQLIDVGGKIASVDPKAAARLSAAGRKFNDAYKGEGAELPAILVHEKTHRVKGSGIRIHGSEIKTALEERLKNEGVDLMVTTSKGRVSVKPGGSHYQALLEKSAATEAGELNKGESALHKGLLKDAHSVVDRAFKAEVARSQASVEIALRASKVDGDDPAASVKVAQDLKKKTLQDKWLGSIDALEP